jgi:hypothetical protein
MTDETESRAERIESLIFCVGFPLAVVLLSLMVGIGTGLWLTTPEQVDCDCVRRHR